MIWREWISRAAVLMLCAALGAGSGGPRSAAAQKLGTRQLIDLAAREPNGAPFREALAATLGENRLRNGTGVTGEGPDFLWAIQAGSAPKKESDLPVIV